MLLTIMKQEYSSVLWMFGKKMTNGKKKEREGTKEVWVPGIICPLPGGKSLSSSKKLEWRSIFLSDWSHLQGREIWKRKSIPPFILFSNECTQTLIAAKAIKQVYLELGRVVLPYGKYISSEIHFVCLFVPFTSNSS